MKRILDIDMDFFLNEIAYWRNGDERLNDIDFVPWSEKEFRTFLENRCLLSKTNRIKGRIITNHDEAFYFWDELIESNNIQTPFSVTHIDAHSDTGFGDAGYVYIVKELMHYPISERREVIDTRKIYMGNYLSFALVCGWICDVKFVLHKMWDNDFIKIHLKDFNIGSRNFQIKGFPKNVDIGLQYQKIINGRIQPIRVDKEIPFSLIPFDKFRTNEQYDYMVFCQSPGYTPKSADYMLEIIKEYIEEI